MSDQPTDRPPRYGGPRNRTRNASDPAQRNRTDPSQRSRNEPTRRSRERDESRPAEDRPHDRHQNRTHETPPPRDNPRSRTHPSSRSPDASQRPVNHDRRNSQPRRYGEAYRQHRSRTPPDRRDRSDGERASHRFDRSTGSSTNPPESRRSTGARQPSPADQRDRETRPRERAPPFDRSGDEDLLEAFEPLDFESEAQERIYRYVERRGVASLAEVEAHVDLPTDDLSDAIRRLERNDYLEERDGTLRIAHNTEVVTEFAVAGVDVTIRPARQEDLADLVALIRTVVDERTYVVAESVVAQLAYEETVIRHTDARTRMFFVATVDAEETADSRLVGWAHLTLSEVDHLDHTAELTVGVHEEFRRRGIGSQLVRTALAWAAANGYRKVYQSLPGTNRAAIDFLDAHGWTIEAVRGDHYRIDGEFVDEVMMAVTL